MVQMMCRGGASHDFPICELFAFFLFQLLKVVFDVGIHHAGC